MPSDLRLAGPIAECKLDLDGLRRQRDRYRRLGVAVDSLERQGDALVVGFGPGLDEALLEETLAIESECCPFFAFEYSPSERRLRIGVAETEQLPALDALAFALSPRSA